MKKLKIPSRRESVFILVFTSLLIVLAIIPTGFEKQIYFNSQGVRAKVLEVNNSGMYKTGIVTQGEQSCVIEIETGSHKGERVEGVNLFIGKYEFDKIFKPGDKAWVLLEFDHEGNILFANVMEHYRIDKQLMLIGLFAITIILFSGTTGIRTLLSFAIALLSIWKILIPLMLKGYNPLAVALVIGNLLTVTTLLLVAGFTKKAYCAILSSAVCSLLTALMAVAFTYYFKIDGTVMQWSESLLYAGFMSLDLTAIFQSAVYLACSGAILDLAIDISAALDEIVISNPKVSSAELMRCGLRIGKSVVGSQTTTLLLAYMGTYVSVLMVYMAQGTPMMNILNSKAISAEILHTFTGCTGLVLVSPLTSAICSFMYKTGNRSVVAENSSIDTAENILL